MVKRRYTSFNRWHGGPRLGQNQCEHAIITFGCCTCSCIDVNTWFVDSLYPIAGQLLIKVLPSLAKTPSGRPSDTRLRFETAYSQGLQLNFQMKVLLSLAKRLGAMWNLLSNTRLWLAFWAMQRAVKLYVAISRSLWVIYIPLCQPAHRQNRYYVI